MRLSFNIAYDGSNYSGWQVQPNGKTVQEFIEQAFETILRYSIPITGCGRTDTGVHASDYYFHCDVEDDSVIIDKIVYQLNSVLPDDISIKNVSVVNSDWSARYSALTRSYEYFIHTEHNPFIRHYSFYYPNLKELPYIEIDAYCDFINSQREFKTLCKSKSAANHYRCNIYSVEFRELGNHRYVFNIKANRFLRGMIRLMVGAMLNVARGKLSINDLKLAFDNQESLPINWSVPGHALFLSRVTYPEIK